MEEALAFLRWEAALALAACLALLLLLIGARRRPGALPVTVLGLTFLQLAWYGQGLHPTLPAAAVLEPPPLAREALEAGGGRIFTQSGSAPGPEIHPRVGPVGFHNVLGKVSELDPYVAVLWGLPYSLHQDFDLMFTPWNHHAHAVFARAWPAPEPSRRILAAWGVRHAFLEVEPEERLRLHRERGHLGPPAVRVGVAALPLVRAVPRVETVPPHMAFDALASRAFEVETVETCLGDAPRPARDLAPPSRLQAGRLGSSLTADYVAGAESFVVVATTFDAGWRASLAGSEEPLALCPTALGQIGIFLPPGTNRLILRYRTPWLLPGAALTLGSLVLGALMIACGARGAGQEDPP